MKIHNQSGKVMAYIEEQGVHKITFADNSQYNLFPPVQTSNGARRDAILDPIPPNRESVLGDHLVYAIRRMGFRNLCGKLAEAVRHVIYEDKHVCAYADKQDIMPEEEVNALVRCLELAYENRIL